MQQFLAKPDGRYDITVFDSGTGRSINLPHRDGHREHGFDCDLEVHLDDDDHYHGFDGESDDHNGDRRMRS